MPEGEDNDDILTKVTNFVDNNLRVFRVRENIFISNEFSSIDARSHTLTVLIFRRVYPGL